MNIEWVEEAMKLLNALLNENYFTAWSILERLHPALTEFTDQLLASKEGQDH